MNEFISLTVAGIATYGCVYALTAMGLVVTYTTSGIFNFAQGAIGMIAAFFFYELSRVWHIPALLALIISVFIFAPAIGATLERVVMRRLENAALEAKLTVSIALLLLGIALATAIWNPQTVRNLPNFFNGHQVSIGGVNLTYQQLIVVATAVLAALGLRLFFMYTRAGVATRAVVDDRELASLTGAAPARFAQLGWAMGCGLAALAGILIAPQNGALNITNLTLLVVNGYAAAMVGRLRSLPMTFVGAIVLGVLYSYALGYLPSTLAWNDFANITPMLFLLLVILVLPQPKAMLSRRALVRAPRIVGLRESLIAGGALIVAGIVFSRVLSGDNLGYANAGLALGLIMLSLVLLTGYGGQVSLCQFTFAGLGAYAMSKVGGSGGSLLGILAAMGLAGAIGALVALPSLRLRGLYLALATLAFAEAMDTFFFNNPNFFGAAESISVARPNVFGLKLDSDRTLLIALSVAFAVVAVLIVALRRSRFGRRLVAINDSPAACLTVGVDMTRSKLAVFTVSAAIAGLGGALYGGAQTQVGPNDFQFILSLTLLLIAVVWGIRTTAGMLFGGIIFALGPLLEQHLTHPRDAFEVLVGLAAIGVSQNPEGTFGGNTLMQRWRDSRRPPQTEAALATAGPESSEGRLTHAAG
jgi:branched-chain amino acid transport system permease protein